jgi:hypothetical protein
MRRKEQNPCFMNLKVIYVLFTEILRSFHGERQKNVEHEQK